MTDHWSDRLHEFGPCSEGLRWAQKQPTYEIAWAACDRLDWLLWWAASSCSSDRAAHRTWTPIVRALERAALEAVRVAYDAAVDYAVSTTPAIKASCAERARRAMWLAEEYALLAETLIEHGPATLRPSNSVKSLLPALNNVCYVLPEQRLRVRDKADLCAKAEAYAVALVRHYCPRPAMPTAWLLGKAGR